MALEFTYGDYSFDPKPLFTVSKEYIKTPSNIGLGTRYQVSLQGQIIPQTGRIPNGDPQAGIQQVFSGVHSIQRAFDNDFQLLHLRCEDGSSSIISGYPRVVSFDIDNASDNYVIRSNYTIVLEMTSLTGTGFDPVGPDGACGPAEGDFSKSGIVSYTDEFTVEFLDERVGGNLSMGLSTIPSIFSIQRSLSVQGDSQVTFDENRNCATYIEPWERAKRFVQTRIGFPSDIMTLSGLLRPDDQVSNNFRTVSVNKSEGTVNVNETYIAMTGSERAYEDFEVNISQSLEEPFVTITVDGTVNGLTDLGYDGTSVTGTPKFNNATSQWQSSISGGLYSRAAAVYAATPIMSGHIAATTLNPYALTQTVGYNPIAGTINYSYVYNNRPLNCCSIALVEDITFSEGEPADVFASLTILGKVSGPLLQSIGTIGQRTRELSINAILPIVSDCASASFSNAPDVYDALVLNYAASLNTVYNQVFVTNSEKTWEPKTGRFSLQQSWTVGSC